MKFSAYLEKLEDMTGKKVIVTGGTSGIGLALVEELLAKNAEVVIMARNITKAEEVKNKLLEKYPNNHLTIIKYDQSDKESIIAACQEIIAHHSDFYALVLNAGIIQSSKATTYVNDIPQTINTNFIGTSLIINRLLYQLEGNHRIILHGSLVAGLKIKKITTLKIKNNKAFKHYIISKAGIEALFYYHSQQNYPNITFYLVEPGITDSNIIRDFPFLVRKLGHPFLKAFSHSPYKAALGLMLALQANTNHNSFIVPRGLLTMMGCPRIKKFPSHRERTYMIALLNDLY